MRCGPCLGSDGHDRGSGNLLSTILRPQVQCAVASDSSESTGAASTNVRALPPARGGARSNRFGRVALHASPALNAATVPSPQEEVEFQAFRTRFGTAHQAVLPPFAPEKPPGDDRSVLVWAPDTVDQAGPPSRPSTATSHARATSSPDPRLKGSLIELALAAWGAHPGDAGRRRRRAAPLAGGGTRGALGGEELAALADARSYTGGRSGLCTTRSRAEPPATGRSQRSSLSTTARRARRPPTRFSRSRRARRRPAAVRGAGGAPAASPWALFTP